MSTGLQSQRVTLYTGADAGTDTGWGSVGYTAGESRWASVVDVAGREVTVGGQAQQNVDAVLTMDDDGRTLEAQIDVNGAVRDEAGRFYRVTNAARHPLLRAIVATLAYADDAAATVVESADLALAPAFRWLPTVDGGEPALFDAGFDVATTDLYRQSFPETADLDGLSAVRTIATAAQLAATYPADVRTLRGDLVSTYDSRIAMLEVQWPDVAGSLLQCNYAGGGESMEHLRVGFLGPLNTWAYLPDFRAADESQVGKEVTVTLHYEDRFGAPVLDLTGAPIVVSVILTAEPQSIELPTFQDDPVAGGVSGLRQLSVVYRRPDTNGATHFFAGIAQTTAGEAPRANQRARQLPLMAGEGILSQATTKNAWATSDATGPASVTVRLAGGGYSAAGIVATADPAPMDGQFTGARVFWRRVTLDPGDALTMDPASATCDFHVYGDGDEGLGGLPPSFTGTPHEINIGLLLRPVPGEATLAALRDALEVAVETVAGVERDRSAVNFDPIKFAHASSGPHLGARRCWGRANLNPSATTDAEGVPLIRNAGPSAVTFDFARPAALAAEFAEDRMKLWHFSPRPTTTHDATPAYNGQTYVNIDHAHYVPREAWTLLERLWLPFDVYELLGTGIQKIDLAQGGPTGSASLGYNAALIPQEGQGTVKVSFDWSTQPDRPDLGSPPNGDHTGISFTVTALGQIPAMTDFDIGTTGAARETTALLFGIAGRERRVITAALAAAGGGAGSVVLADGTLAPVTVNNSTIADPAYDHTWASTGRFAFGSDRDMTGQWSVLRALVAHPAAMTPSQVGLECAVWDAALGSLRAAPADPLGPPYPVLGAVVEPPPPTDLYDYTFTTAAEFDDFTIVGASGTAIAVNEVTGVLEFTPSGPQGEGGVVVTADVPGDGAWEMQLDAPTIVGQGWDSGLYLDWVDPLNARFLLVRADTVSLYTLDAGVYTQVGAPIAHDYAPLDRFGAVRAGQDVTLSINGVPQGAARTVPSPFTSGGGVGVRWTGSHPLGLTRFRRTA